MPDRPFLRGDDLGPCPCGHRQAMCNRVVAAQWCGGIDDPFAEGVRLANVQLRDERDAALDVLCSMVASYDRLQGTSGRAAFLALRQAFERARAACGAAPSVGGSR